MAPQTTNKISNLRMLWYFFRPHKKLMALTLLTMGAAGILEALNLAAIYPILNYGLDIQSKGNVLDYLNVLAVMWGGNNPFLGACVSLIVITCLAVAAKVLYQYMANTLITHIVGDNQKAIFNKYLNSDYNYFVQQQQGRLIYAGTVATIGVSNNILYAVRIINNALTCLFFVGLLSVLVWQGMAFFLVVGVLYVVFVRRILNTMINTFSHMSVEEDRQKNVILNEFIAGIKAVKAHHEYDFWVDKYSQAVDKSVLYRFKVLMGKVLPDSFLKFMFFIVLAVIGIVLSTRFTGALITWIPVLGTFATVASRLIPYVNLIGTDVVGIARFLPDTRIVYDTLNEQASQVSFGMTVIKGINKSISLQNVSFRYQGQERDQLDAISFNIEKNKTVALVGPSGSGKTTIVNLLLGLFQSSEGNILVDEQNLKDLDLTSYLSLIGYVGQETFLFNGSIADNIRFGQQSVTQQEIERSAVLANAHDFIMQLENQYDTLVGDAGIKLSGGQRQRIAIARALVRKPQFLILDEATSALDRQSEREVQQAINGIAHQTTTLIVAHRLSTVEGADKIIVLSQGKIIEQGSHDELMKKGNTYYQLYSS